MAVAESVIDDVDDDDSSRETLCVLVYLPCGIVQWKGMCHTDRCGCTATTLESCINTCAGYPVQVHAWTAALNLPCRSGPHIRACTYSSRHREVLIYIRVYIGNLADACLPTCTTIIVHDLWPVYYVDFIRMLTDLKNGL